MSLKVSILSWPLVSKSMARKMGSVMVGVLLLLTFWLLLFLLSITSRNPWNLKSGDIVVDILGIFSTNIFQRTCWCCLSISHNCGGGNFRYASGYYSALAYSLKCMMDDHACLGTYLPVRHWVKHNNLHWQNRHPYIKQDQGNIVCSLKKQWNSTPSNLIS